MKKWVFIGLGAIVVIIAVILIVGLSNLGPIIKHAVNTYGPKITKTELHVDDVGVSIFSAEAKLKKFFLGNPAGFKTQSAMKAGSVFVNVDEGSLKRDTIVIDRIEVKRPEITYEKKRGTDNFNTILSNVTKTASSEDRPKKESKEEGAGKKFIVRNFIVKEGKVNLAMAVYGMGDKEITVPLPDIHLKDIGEKKNGASSAEVFKEIFAALYGKITSPAVTDVFNQQLKTLGASLDTLGKTGKQQLEGIVDKAKDSAKGLKGDTDKIGKGLKDVGKKVKGVFGN